MHTTPQPPPWARDEELERSKDGSIMVPAWETLVRRAFVATFVAERLVKTTEARRTLKDKVGKQFSTAVANGALRLNESDQIRFDDVVRWVHTKHRLADAVKTLLPPGGGSATMKIPAMTLNASGSALPVDLSQSNRDLARALTAQRLLEQENAELKRIVDRLRPLEAAIEKRSVQSRIDGAKGGRPPRS